MGDIHQATGGSTATAPRSPLRPMQHVTRAMGILRDAGLTPTKTSTADNPLVTIMSDLAVLDEAAVVAIARTMAHMQNFNQLIMERAPDVKIGDRFEIIADSFDSIREDNAAMVARAEKGKRSIRDKVGERVMVFRRGTVLDRFKTISKTVQEVFKDLEAQIRLERGLTDGYRVMRIGLKEAQLMAEDLRDKARDQVEAALAAVQDLQQRVDEATDSRTKSDFELQRDNAMVVWQDADRRFQSAEDIYNNLSVAYGVGDSVIARLAQTTDAKERVFRQQVTFYSTNQLSMTVMGLTVNGIQGLSEGTRVSNALKKGSEDTLRGLAEIGSKVQEEALRAGYGATVSVEAVKQLNDAVLEYQRNSRQIIKEMRQLAADNTAALNQVVEESKSQMIELVHHQATESTLPSMPESASRRAQSPGIAPELMIQHDVDTTRGMVGDFAADRKKVEARLAEAVKVDQF